MRAKALAAALVALSLTVLPARAEDADAEQRDLAARVAQAIVALDHNVSGRARDGDAPADLSSRSAGFIISPQGHVLTDARFVRGRRTFHLRCLGGARVRARVLGIDPHCRTAVLQIENPDVLMRRFGRLPQLEWGDSHALRVGQGVFSLGNTFDCLYSDARPAVSRGVVSALGRMREGRYQGPCIQTDAAVNPGCFGGPLVDREGRVVGVLTSSYSSRTWLGSAVPAAAVRLGAEALIAGQAPARGRLGLRVRGTGGEASPDGLEILAVEGDGLREAGVRPGERLLSLDGVRLHDERDLARELEGLGAGSPVRLGLRDPQGARRSVRVALAAAPAEGSVGQRPPETRPPRWPEPTPREPSDALPVEQRGFLGVWLAPGEHAGARVEEIAADSPAARAGLREGDLVQEANGQRIGNTDDFVRLLETKPAGARLALRVLRGRRTRTLTVILGRRGEAEATPEAAPAGRPWLGVSLLPREGGLVVDAVASAGPAAQAGLQAGDVLQAIDEQPLSTLAEFEACFRTLRVGQTITLRVERKGWTKDIPIRLVEKP